MKHCVNSPIFNLLLNPEHNSHALKKIEFINIILH